MPSEKLLPCDLIMKGGVTSGVVYPPAILVLAERFQFKSLAGASAGAIAAAATACAELARQSGNEAPSAAFSGMRRLEAEVASEGFLRKRFQPTYCAPLFDVLSKWLETRHLRSSTDKGWRYWLGWVKRLQVIAREALTTAYGAGVIAGAAVGVLVSTPLFAWALVLARAERTWLSVAGVLLLGFIVLACGVVGMVGGGLGAAWEIVRQLRLLANQEGAGFGICTGSRGAEEWGRRAASPTEEEVASLPLTDWLHARLNALAGRPADAPSPTVEELRQGGVVLKLVTSNVTLGQPWTLPLRRGSRSFFFREDEMAKLFPRPVVEQLVAWARAHPPSKLRFRPGEEGRYLRFPLGESIPVVVATRLSLSFPILLSAVRLYSFSSEAYARSARGGFVDLAEDVEDHWISDGGIASNFPIHLFDAWIPSRPTFGITLYDSPVRRVLEQFEGVLARPVVLPLPRDFDLARPRRIRIDGLRDFLSAILGTAQNFRDVAQSALPSYRERIVQIFLEPHEGGLNLDMSSQTIRDIQEKGRRAGALLLERYSEDSKDGPTYAEGFLEHRWVRMLVLFGQLEVELSKLQALGGSGPGWKAEVRRIFDQVFAAHSEHRQQGWYRQKDEAWLRAARARIETLLDFVEAWSHTPDARMAPQPLFSREPPRPEAILRITPDI